LINKNSLIFKFAFGIASTSMVISILAGNIFYKSTYESELKYALESVNQIELTVSNTASIATYLNDPDLANEVIIGLEKNNIITSAQIRSKEKTLASSLDFDSNNVISYQLYSPFMKTEVIGKILIHPNKPLIELRAQKIADKNLKVLIFYSVIITLISIFIAYYLVTKPFENLSFQLSNLIPGNCERINEINLHTNDEIAITIHNINALLDKTQTLFDQEKTMRLEIETLQKRLKMLFENAKSCIVLATLEGDLLMFNKSCEDLLNKIGVPIQNNFNDILTLVFDNHQGLIQLVLNAVQNDDVAQGEFKLKNHIDDSIYWVQVFILLTKGEDDIDYFQIFLTDISARKAEMKALSYQANFDKLTQLYNRHATEQKLEQMMAENINLCLLIIDLNDFKPINDTYGHEAGDLILKHISKQFKISLRKGDIAARWGGDEFVITLKQVNKENASQICNKLLDKIKTPIVDKQQNVTLKVGASIGIAFFPENANTLTDLINCADQAMYRVKRSEQKHDFCFYK
jgi:diguanylate cyclase (GGDEF)-like protein